MLYRVRDRTPVLDATPRPLSKSAVTNYRQGRYSKTLASTRGYLNTYLQPSFLCPELSFTTNGNPTPFHYNMNLFSYKRQRLRPLPSLQFPSCPTPLATSRTDAAVADNELSVVQKFGTAGLGGVLGWWVIHPFNTLAVRMNLLGASGQKLPSFFAFSKNVVAKHGITSVYDGIGAGTVRQIFYATSRFGLFEVFRDLMAGTTTVGDSTIKGEVTPFMRLSSGLLSGGMAAVIACPAEVTLVRMSNDQALPTEQRRHYKHFGDAVYRTLTEEGVSAFWKGVVPFAQRAVVVGVCQVGTFDQGKEFYERSLNIQRGTTLNVFCAAMTSGLFYSLVTMPLESAKNRLASSGGSGGSTLSTIKNVVGKEGVLALWNGFLPYYLRCGGHTTSMFVMVEWLRRGL